LKKDAKIEDIAPKIEDKNDDSKPKPEDIKIEKQPS